MRPLIFGHRGSSAYAPENTLAAIALSYEQQADGVEVDIQYTKDQQIVVIHDFSVDRTSNGKGLVRAHTLEELQRLDFGSWFSPDFEGEKIMTLETLFTYIKETKMQLNIEIKVDAINYDPRLVADLNRQLKDWDIMSQVIVSSFYHQSLQDLRKVNPDIEMGLLYAAGFCEIGRYAKKIDAQYVHPQFTFIDEELIENCRQHQIRVNTWTVNTKEEYDRIKEGANIVISNNPNLFLTGQ